MILGLTTMHGNARGALECGGLTPPSPLGPYALGTLRRRQAAALQGAFGTVISTASKDLRSFFRFNDLRKTPEVLRFAPGLWLFAMPVWVAQTSFFMSAPQPARAP